MSEYVTHVAVVDDCARLTAAAAELPDCMAAAFAAHPDLSRLGAVTRGGDRCNPPLLAGLRAALAAGDLDAAATARLAFVLGWLGHRAADRTMKPVFRDLDGDCRHSPSDCSLYHDACVLREIHGLDAPPFDPEMLAAETGADAVAGLPADAFAAVDRLARLALQRGLISLHTLIPDPDDPGGWLAGLIALHQRRRVDLERLASAVYRPDPERWRRFVVEPPFYDPADPAVAAARDGRSYAGGEPTCLYGRALDRAFGYLRAAGAYLAGEFDAAALHAALEIGRPELAG